MAAHRGRQGAVLKAMRSMDYTFTVREVHDLTDRYRRILVDTGGLLQVHEVPPTMWVRLWFDAGRRIHQRGYTLVDPDVESDSCWLEFAMHDGLACSWAAAARPGTTIEATVQGAGLVLPSADETDAYVVAGDPASVPAVNSLLDHLGAVPAEVHLEWQHDTDRTLPIRVRPQDSLTWVPRQEPSAMVAAVAGRAADIGIPGDRLFGWAACDARTTRQLTGVLRRDYGIPKERVKTMGYWRP